MKKMSILVIVVLVSILAAPLLAKELSSTKQAKDLAISATDLIGQNRIREGILLLKDYWPLPGSEIENLINQTEMQWTMVEKRFGQPIAVEFVREEKVADSFVKYLFIQKFEHHAIRWVLIFYKPRDVWKVNNIEWDDQINLLFSK